MLFYAFWLLRTSLIISVKIVWYRVSKVQWCIAPWQIHISKHIFYITIFVSGSIAFLKFALWPMPIISTQHCFRLSYIFCTIVGQYFLRMWHYLGQLTVNTLWLFMNKICAYTCKHFIVLFCVCGNYKILTRSASGNRPLSLWCQIHILRCRYLNSRECNFYISSIVINDLLVPKEHV